MRDRAIVAEWEIFDLGMLDHAAYLRTKGLLPEPRLREHPPELPGDPAGHAPEPGSRRRAPPRGATWAPTGIGRYQLEMNRLAIAMGGHVRVGLEDNLWWDADRTELATNPRLVERLVRIGRAMGREPASPAQVRAGPGSALRP